MPDNAPPSLKTSGWRWPGVLLSLLIPGFGLVRAGRVARGVAWFIGLQLIALLATLIAIWQKVPFWLVIAAFVIALGVQLAMLVDSFRPGRLSGRLWVVFILALVLVAVAPTAPHLVARVFITPSRGMEPTLRGQASGTPDHVLVDHFSYRFSPPRRGDLVVFHTAGIEKIGADSLFVQRLVGLPGEKIEIRDGQLFADGRPLNQDDGIPDVHYTAGPTVSDTSRGGVYEVPEGSYFMLGDNALNSLDSRFWGYLPKENVYGRIARIYYPFSRASVPR